MDERRLSVEDMENIVRSFAMSPSLPVETIRRVLIEHREVLQERREIGRVLEQLGPGFAEVRRLLNDLHRLVNAQEASPR